MTTARLHTDDGITLEAIVDAPDDVRGTLILCHPHPQHGGTMRAPILSTIASRAVAAGYRALRFNFRGVGESTGTFGDGIAELTDVAAAAAFAETLDEPLAGITGWSFGAAAALNWQALSDSAIPYVGIAPPVTSPLSPHLPDAARLVPATRQFIIGARDQFVAAEDLKRYATSIGAAVVVYPSADHFFVFKHDKLADDVIAAISS
ncbi:MAG: dienelactone hydrolase family protein [Actinomycetia bacterium]|nr:dienelactone hydrolase family protein [Actinomycetes bacterium]